MGENAYVLGGASALSNQKRRVAINLAVKNLAGKNLEALQTKTAQLCKARLLSVLCTHRKHLFGCLSGNFYRRDACICMAVIAKRLFGTFTTSAPEKGFAY
tara:strand:+ start:801 stop:1103 length:303 start_codon:yes stop_codon:yes gene_type:complete